MFGTAWIPARGVYAETCDSWRLIDVCAWIRHKFAEIESLNNCGFAVSGDVLLGFVNRYLLFGDRIEVEKCIEWDVIKKLAHQYSFNLNAVDFTKQRICFAMVEDRPHEIILLSAKGDSQDKEASYKDEVGNQTLLFSRVNDEIEVEAVDIGKGRKRKAKDSKGFSNAKQ